MQESRKYRSTSMFHPYPGIYQQGDNSSSKKEQYTFITDSLGGSDCVDQCIYRFEKPVSEGKLKKFDPVQNDDLSDSAFSYVGGERQVGNSYKEYLEKYNELGNTQQGNTKKQNMQQQNTK